jgi:SNF2 family DNA or RNA helicase
MSVPEHRNPLGQLRFEPNIINVDAIDPLLSKPRSNDAPSVDDLASSMARTLHIQDADEDDYENVTGKVQTVDWKKQNKEMDKMFESQSAQQLQNLPEFVRPKEFKKSVTLFDHQVDGIRWLLKQEQNAPPNPFVRERRLKDGTLAVYDKLSQARLKTPHPPVKGSILADDMGLGKTVQTLGLILSNLPEGYVFGKTDGADLEDPICTLIVCPKTVISNWITQIGDFVKAGKLNVVTYTGTPKQRSKIIERVEENEIDILVSTYETSKFVWCCTVSSALTIPAHDRIPLFLPVAAEYEKDRKGLMGICDVAYHRIVLDEAQQIRNSKSKCFKSIEAVARKAEFRLALTGTVSILTVSPQIFDSLFGFVLNHLAHFCAVFVAIC